MQTDYILTSLLFSNINKISSGYLLIDIVGIIFLLISLKVLSNEKMSKIQQYFYSLFTPKTNTITFSANSKEISHKYRALMYFISQNEDKSVKELSEVEIKTYNPRLDSDETTSSVYRVTQANEFKITDKINGKVYFLSKDKTEHNGKVQYVEYQNLEISSNFLTLKELSAWVDEIEKEYRKYLKHKMLDTQTLVEISWDTRENNFTTLCTPWESNVSFANRFFNEKEAILSKINFFLNNEAWYNERGIPYTLGILLWGDPGCGKTGFIKALMNLTKRHALDIKLSKKFDMTKLREIICNEDIDNDIIIPQNKRILLFEDIDAMGDIVKDRDLPKEAVNVDQINECVNQALSKKMRKSSRRSHDDFLTGDNILEDTNTENNNLSYFLNILDGLHECPGRIIIMTTNKPEYLDKALIRPGRIDFKINMTKATLNDIREILNFYWKTNSNIILNNNNDKKLSHAEIISCCRSSNNIDESITKINNSFSSNESIYTCSDENEIDIGDNYF